MATVQLYLRECREGGLPKICAQCGARATHIQDRLFTWRPFWVYLLLPTVIPFIVASQITTRRRLMPVPFCLEHRYHWSRRGTLTGCYLGALVGFFYFSMFVIHEVFSGSETAGVVFFILWVLLGIGFLVHLILLYASTIKATDISERSMTLKNVAPDFIVALEAFRVAEDQALNLDRTIQDRWRNEPRDKMPDDWKERRPTREKDREHYRNRTNRDREDREPDERYHQDPPRPDQV
jgi:hypothetical protein